MGGGPCRRVPLQRAPQGVRAQPAVARLLAWCHPCMAPVTVTARAQHGHSTVTVTARSARCRACIAPVTVTVTITEAEAAGATAGATDRRGASLHGRAHGWAGTWAGTWTRPDPWGWTRGGLDGTGPCGRAVRDPAPFSQDRKRKADRPPWPPPGRGHRPLANKPPIFDGTALSDWLVVWSGRGRGRAGFYSGVILLPGRHAMSHSSLEPKLALAAVGRPLFCDVTSGTKSSSSLGFCR